MTDLSIPRLEMKKAEAGRHLPIPNIAADLNRSLCLLEIDSAARG